MWHLKFVIDYFSNIADDVKSICEVPVEIIIESASRCLSEINHNLKIPTKLPSGISHRIEVASQIASVCKVTPSCNCYYKIVVVVII